MARSTRWYVAALGFNVVREVETVEFTRAILGPGDGSSVFGITQHHTNTGDGFSEAHTGMDHVAFAVGSQAELALWRKHFDRLGIGYTMPRPGLIVLRDPDGIQLELCAR